MAKETSDELSIYLWWHGKASILELKRWVDKQVEAGNNVVSLKIEWGYYNDIDELKLVASVK